MQPKFTFKCQNCASHFSQEIAFHMHEAEGLRSSQINSTSFINRESKLAKKVPTDKHNLPSSLIEKKTQFKTSMLGQKPQMLNSRLTKMVLQHTIKP